MQFQNYRVSVGDTLEKIALRFYGSTSRAAELARANGITPPYLVSIGQTLVIPLDETASVITADASQPGDDLPEVVVTATRERLPAWVWLALALAAAWALSDRRRLF